MATMTLRFRGICCFIDKMNGEPFQKRVVLPSGRNHRHSVIEPHLPIIEFFADDLDEKESSSDLRLAHYTRPGDDAKYTRIDLAEPVLIELENVSKGKIEPGPNLDEEPMIHLDSLLKGQTFGLKRNLLGQARDVDRELAAAVIDLPTGMLMAGPPEPTLTRFSKPVQFQERRVARWFDHIFKVDGTFGLMLKPLGGSGPTKFVRFKSTTRLVTIAHEPERLIVGHFVKKGFLAKMTSHAGHHGGAAAEPQPTGHFDMYWDLIADPPASRPVPEPAQGGGVGCNPSGKP